MNQQLLKKLIKATLTMLIMAASIKSQSTDTNVFLKYQIPGHKQATGGQNTAPPGGYGTCSCSRTYDYRSTYRGCAYCPTNCYKIEPEPNRFKCNRCSPNCNTCKDSSQCVTCAESFFLKGVGCERCEMPNCKDCSGPGLTCDRCQDGFFLNNATKSCNACAANCNKCVNKESCKSCRFTYEWNAGLKFCKQMPWWKRSLIWIGIVFCVLLAIGCLIAYLWIDEQLFGRYRRRNRRFGRGRKRNGGGGGIFSVGDEGLVPGF